VKRQVAALVLTVSAAIASGAAAPAVAGPGRQIPAAQTATQAASIVDSVLDAYGGEERLRSVQAYRLEASMIAHTRGHAASAVRISAGSKSLQVMITSPANTEIRIIDTGRGYSGSALDSLAQAEGPALAAMRLQAARANLPWILAAMRDAAAHVRTEGPYEVLELRLSETEALRLLVDTRTYFIVTTEAQVNAGPMDFLFRTEYSDFREVEGITFAFHEENYAAGAHTATTTVDAVQLNPPEERRTLR